MRARPARTCISPLTQTLVRTTVPISFPRPRPPVYHSTSPHKEFRFLLPVLPIAHAYAGQAVSALLAAAGRPGGSSDPGQRQQRQRRLGTVATVALFMLHVPAALYLSVWHQSGALSAVDAVAREIPAFVASKMAVAMAAGGEPSVDVSVHFLMPCHSAPLHSHLHFRGERGGREGGAVWSGKPSLWSLDCSPK